MTMRKDKSRRGWVIVASCFCVGFFLDGIKYSYGLLFIELLAEFKRSRAETSWIGALLTGWNMLGELSLKSSYHRWHAHFEKQFN